MRDTNEYKEAPESVNPGPAACDTMGDLTNKEMS